MIDVREQELQSIIESGKEKAATVLTEIQTEFQEREDFIVKPKAMEFDAVSNIFGVNINDTPLQITQHARNQFFSKCTIPIGYANRLLELGENELLLNNVNIMNSRKNEDGLLVRQVNGRIKGILSPSYRRMDASPIFESFVKSCLADGYVPYTGRVTDYRYHVCFILPQVFNPTPDEYIVFGLAITTSDYGASALKVEQVILRISCKNLALGNDIMRSVHIGKRFDATEDFVKLSDETHILDSKAIASAVGDIVDTSKEKIDYMKTKIEQAMMSHVNINEAMTSIGKKGFSKTFTSSVKNMYESDLPVKLLPKGDNLWRLSNAISLVAGSQEDGDVALDAQNLAMSIL